MQPPRKIIIDTDPGQDDAVAILLALASPELEVLGLTAVAGNVPLALTARNVRIVCEIAGRPDVPVFAFGHSLGGLVTTQYALVHGGKLKGVVLSGAALQCPKSVGDFAADAAQFVAAIGPGLKIVKVDDSEFSRDPEVMARLVADPLVTHDNLPAATAAASIKGMAEVQARAAELRMPFLVMYGLDDKVNPTEGSDMLLQSISSSDKSLKTYPKVYHDMRDLMICARLT